MRRLSTQRRIIDLRSDTVTLPSAAMRQVMLNAPMGDDVYGEDPSCLALERRAAELMGKQHSVFLSSGTQGNLASFMAHCQHRDSEIICGDKQHTYLYEQGGSASLAGIHTRVVPNSIDGTLPIQAVLAAVQSGFPDQHYARTCVVSVENTHNMCGGVPLPLAYLDDLRAAIGGSSIKLHMDGARACNAAVALNVPLHRVCSAVDSVSLCLSKALGAPVGSLVASDDAAFILRVRRAKKALGGGWRKAGGLASAGLFALERYEETLTRDHALAKLLAQELQRVPGIQVPSRPQTNMVFFQVTAATGGATAAEELSVRAKQEGVWLGGTGYGLGGDLMRCVLHQNITEQDVERAVQVVRGVMSASASG